MTFTISATDIQNWHGFLQHPDVDVQAFLDPAAAGSNAQPSPRCVNTRFFSRTFEASDNTTRFGQLSLPAGTDSILLALKKDATFIGIGLKDILTATGISPTRLGVSDGAANTFDKAVNVFLEGDPISFRLSEDLDTTASMGERRNAMWLTPGDNSMRIDTTLTFAPETSKLDTLKEKIGLPISLDSLQAITLVVQRTSKGVPFTTPGATTRTSSGKNNNPSAGTSSATPKWKVTTTYQVAWRLSIENFALWITFGPAGCEISLMATPSDGTLPASLWSDLTGLVTSLQGKDIAPKSSAGILDNINLLKVRYAKQSGAGQWQIMASVDLPNGGPAIYLGYDTLSSTFSGGLILQGFYSTETDMLLPNYVSSQSILAPSGIVPARFWDLSKFFSVTIPSYLPHAVITASVSYTQSTQAGASVLRLSARAVQTAKISGVSGGVADESGKATVPSGFTWDELDVFLEKQQHSLSCSLFTFFTLTAPVGKDYPPAEIALSVIYDDRGWELHGSVENLSAGLLYSFFDVDSQSAALDLLGKLNIASLDLLWTHTKGGASAAFLFSGMITFGGLELRLFYQYISSQADSASSSKIADALKNADGPPVISVPTGSRSSWQFECDLGSSSGDATIGSIANSFLDDASGSLPSFVSNIPIPKADGTNGRAPVSLKAGKFPATSSSASQASPATGGTGSAQESVNQDYKIIFVFQFAIGVFTMTLIQIADVPGDKNTKPQPTKRLLRFAVDKLPVKDNIPLLDRLPQPFDQLEYVWVSSPVDNPTGSNTVQGLTRQEIDVVNNSNFLSDKDKLLVKATTKQGSNNDNPPRAGGEATTSPSPPTDPIVLQSGHHFMVINGGEVAVDHIFNTSSSKDDTTKSSQQQQGTSSQQKAVVSSSHALKPMVKDIITRSDDPAPSSPAKGSLSFKLGPLTVDGITLQFKEQSREKSLVLTLNATFTMGPIVFSLLGFGITVGLSGDITLNNLEKALDDIGVVLAGMAISFNKPPLLIAGGFEHKVIQTATGSENIFLGGIGVSFPPYTFVGLGEYAIVTVGQSQYKSIFLFAKLDGPLITLEFATISGVRLGLGYNSYVTSPDANSITQFPFIDDGSTDGAGNDPMAILRKMTEPDPKANGTVWVQPKLNSYWFAAGMSVTAFDILNITAVVMLAFRDSGLVATIYADAIATMPPDAPKGAAIVYVEIGMLAEMNFADGYFRVEASLAPTSYLLVPQCHLYGGFALVYWFPPSDHSGDWVFSIGGYHRAYTPPPWYPVPTRLGISFNIDIISITGEAYFAVTPKCVMGGAMMHASLSFGPIEAWMDYSFDTFINFHPLHYSVDFAVSIGINFNIDILFIHIHIHASVGAQLHIEGPEFGGIAHVDFYLFGFDVDFGASPSPPVPLDIYQFFLLVHKPGPDSSSDPSLAHESPVLSWIDVESTQKDDNLSSANDALVHTPTRVVDTQDGAAFKYILEDGNFPMPQDPDTSGGQPKSTGAGTKWFVKGGSFQFRISTDFAINDAILVTENARTPRHPDNAVLRADNSSATGVPPAPKSSICSKPMQLTQDQGKETQSTLTVTVARVISETVLDPTPIYKWRTFTLQAKPMANAVWGSYDRSQDPSKNQRPSTLLDGNSATVDMFMSVGLSAPPPELCPRPEWPGFIPKFKATAAARFGIRDFRTDPGGTDWFVPMSHPTQEKFLPRELTQTEKTETNKKRWEDTSSAWLNLGTKKTQDLVHSLLNQVATTLQWDQNRSQLETQDINTVNSALQKQAATTSGDAAKGQSVDLPSAWKLVGNVPTKLIKNMESTYLDLPQLAVGVAA